MQFFSLYVENLWINYSWFAVIFSMSLSPGSVLVSPGILLVRDFNLVARFQEAKGNTHQGAARMGMENKTSRILCLL